MELYYAVSTEHSALTDSGDHITRGVHQLEGGFQGGVEHKDPAHMSLHVCPHQSVACGHVAWGQDVHLVLGGGGGGGGGAGNLLLQVVIAGKEK